MKELREFEARFSRGLGQSIEMLETAVRTRANVVLVNHGKLRTPKRGRPRSVPQEGRATSHPRRDKHRRKMAAAAKAEMDAKMQALSEVTRQLPELARRAHRRYLWAAMDALCTPPA
jgi:hypothetical protein